MVITIPELHRGSVELLSGISTPEKKTRRTIKPSTFSSFSDEKLRYFRQLPKSVEEGPCGALWEGPACSTTPVG